MPNLGSAFLSICLSLIVVLPSKLNAEPSMVKTEYIMDVSPGLRIGKAPAPILRKQYTVEQRIIYSLCRIEFGRRIRSGTDISQCRVHGRPEGYPVEQVYDLYEGLSEKAVGESYFEAFKIVAKTGGGGALGAAVGLALALNPWTLVGAGVGAGFLYALGTIDDTDARAIPLLDADPRRATIQPLSKSEYLIGQKNIDIRRGLHAAISLLDQGSPNADAGTQNR